MSAKVHLKTNISFLLILIGIIFLAIIEGDSISKTFLGENTVIIGGEIQQIAFLILTIIILGIATLHPEKLNLAAYLSMTLGFIIIVGVMFDPTLQISQNLKIIEIIIGVVLIIAGVFITRGNKLSEEDKVIVDKGLKSYNK